MKCEDQEIRASGNNDLDCLQYDYDEGILKQIRPSLEVILPTSIILCLILDIATYRWRKLANIILYFECTIALAEGMIPVLSWNSVTSLQVNILMLGLFLCFYTDHVGQVIYTSLIHGILKLVIQPVFYRDPLAIEIVFIECFYIIALFMVNLFISVLLLYITAF